ncbi:MAG: hypothetical protein WDZ91_12615 [Paenibacillaceae bacterium]
MIVKEGTWISMISFQPFKTRTFRGINAYERFGQSIVNKYVFNSKPYLGMLNLLFLEPADEHVEDHKQNLYNFMVLLRMQLEKQQHNKEYNLFASRPFLYTMLEKILIKQSLYGSELKAYRNYITLLNVNGVNESPVVTHNPTKKVQFIRTSTQFINEQTSIAKAFARITVSPDASIGQTTARMDHQLIYQYRKPLIESIWMNRITSHTTDMKLTSLVNKLYRATEDNQLLHSMNSVERIVLNQRILKQVYAYGRQHDVLEFDAEQQWFEQTEPLIHHNDEYEQIHSTLRQNVTRATARIEANIQFERRRTSTIRTPQDHLRTEFIRNYRRPLTQTIWNDQISKSKQTQESTLSTLTATESVWLNQNSENIVEQFSSNTSQLMRKNKGMISQTNRFRIYDIFDQSFVEEILKSNRRTVNYLVEQGIQINKPVELYNLAQTPNSEMDMLEVVKSLIVVANRIANVTNESETIIDKSVTKQYKRQLSDSIWMNRILQQSQSPYQEKQDYSTTVKLRNQRILHVTNQSVTSDLFDLKTIEERLQTNRRAVTYMVDNGIHIDKPVQMTTSNPTQIDQSEEIDIVKSLTTIINRNTNRSSIKETANTSTTDKYALTVEELNLASKHYRRQLADSIWISRMINRQEIQSYVHPQDYTSNITRSNHRMLTRTRTSTSSAGTASIFDQQMVIEQLMSNHKAISYMLDYGIEISNPLPLTVPTPIADHTSEVLEVVKSLTSIVNRATTVTGLSNDTIITNRSRMTSTHYDELSSEMNILSKQYKRQLADSIWISRMRDSQRIQTLEQPHDHTTTITRRNYRMLTRKKNTAAATTVAAIFDQQNIVEKLSSNQRAIKFLLDYGVEISKPVQLTVPSPNVDHTSEVIEVVKSLTSFFNRATAVTNTTNVSRMDHVNYDVLSMESQTISKQYKRQLSDSVWISRMIDKSYAELLEQQLDHLMTIAQSNHRMLIRTTSTSTSTSKATIKASIFDYQHVIETLKSNRKAIEYLADYGVEISKPTKLIISNQAEVNFVDVQDVVKSLTRIVNRASQETSIPSLANTTNIAPRSFNIKHGELLSESQSISKQYNRRLSDSVWISKILDVSQAQFTEQNTNSSTRISRRNKRILHKSIVSITAEIFDQKLVEERVQANRKALNYLIDLGIPIEKPVQLVTPSPNMEPEFIQDVVKAISKIEFGNSMMTKSINKYFVQQYRRQLTESIWMKQIHEQTSYTARKKTTLEEQNIDSFLSENYLQKMNRTNKRITHQTLATNVTDMFNNRIVEQRLQHNKIAVQHLQELGITMNSSVDLLLPNQLRDLTEPVNDVVKAVTRIVAALPSLNREKTNKVIPIEVLRQYRRQLTDSVTMEHHESVDLRVNKSMQHSLRMKVNNPIIQALHQKVSGSVFDPIIIDERIFRDIVTTRRSSNLSNHTIEQRTDALLSWLLPKSNGTVMVPSAMIPTVIQQTENNNRMSNRSILRRLQLIRSNYHQMDSHTLETVQAYTSSLFTSTEIDYLNHTISGIPHTHHRTIGRKNNNPSVNLMNTKITWLQGIVDHLVKSTTISNIGSDRLTTEKRKLSKEHMLTNLQPLFVVPDSSVTQGQSQTTTTAQPISLIHSSPAIALDKLNDELTHRIDTEASLDYLIPKPAVTPSPPEPTIQPVDLDIHVEQDKVAINPMNNIDMTELVDRIYSEIERKMTFERQRRGF